MKTNEYNQPSEAGRDQGDEWPLKEVTVPDNHCSGIMSKQNEEPMPIYEISNFYYKQLHTQNMP